MRFLIDVMCGGLIPYLRMCGYDTVYADDAGLEADDMLVQAANADGRVLITRDIELAGRLPDSRSILLESTAVEGQLAELLAAGVALEQSAEPEWCGRCNGQLKRCDEMESTPEYAPEPAETVVWKCLDCGQHFWQGSHWDRVEKTLERIRSQDCE